MSLSRNGPLALGGRYTVGVLACLLLRYPAAHEYLAGAHARATALLLPVPSLARPSCCCYCPAVCHHPATATVQLCISAANIMILHSSSFDGLTNNFSEINVKLLAQ